MFGRGILGKIITGGILAAIGYMLMPKRRNRMMLLRQWPISRRDLWKVGRYLARAVR
ncbi:hypothetical protein ACQCN2_02675 [Brevibacillus ginsengisoli]|uniref:hypothetical protein n=1 Tax=Brevibacillus ginsengisoli TaxID=363854 RepID=UPI003CF22445